MARSSVFDAATVMVSSDCTGVPPIWAYAFRTGAGRLRSLHVLRFRLALGLLLLFLPIRRTAGTIRGRGLRETGIRQPNRQ